MADFPIRSSEGGTLTAGQALRDEYLDALTKMQLPAIVGVYGQSASGKSTTIKTLQEIGIEPARRFVTRSSGATGDLFEVPWRAETPVPQAPEIGRDNTLEIREGDRDALDVPLPRSDLFNNVLFAIHNYGTYYGTKADEVAQILKEPDRKAISVLMGKLIDLPNFSEAISNLFPLLPRVGIRLMIEPYQLFARLAKRVRDDNGRAEEAQARIELLMQKYIEDQVQITPYRDLYRLVLINAVLNEGASEMAPINVGASVKTVLQRELERLIFEEKQISAELAKEVKRPRSICYEPEALRIALETVLPRTSVQRNSITCKYNLYLTGQLGMMPYLEGIDAGTISSMFRNCKSVEFLCVEGTSAQYSRYRRGEIQQSGDNERVEVRVQARRIISALEGSFCVEFFCDHADQILAREVVVDKLGVLYVVPPEHLIVEGCVSIGLNSEEGQFLDVLVYLMARQLTDVNIIHRLIFMQDYDPSLDEGFYALIKSWKDRRPQSLEQFIASSFSGAETLLRKLPAHLKKRLIDFEKIHPQPLDNSRNATLSCSCVKRSIMMAGILNALDKLNARVINMENFKNDQLLIASFQGHIEKLDLAVRVFLDNQIGRGDIFVKRSRPGMHDNFFSRFPDMI